MSGMLDAGIGARLSAVRRRMRAAGVDVYLCRSTDRFLNEYVPTESSTRVWLSGFTGSMGEVIVTQTEAFLAVDGRYWIQAEKEAPKDLFHVLRVPPATGIDTTVIEKLNALAQSSGGKKLVIGYDPSKLTTAELQRFERSVRGKLQWKSLFPAPDEAARGPHPSVTEPKLRALDEKRFGQTVEEKLERLAERFAELAIDGVLVQRLDEIAYLSNLRGQELPYQATFCAIALATKNRLFIGMDPSTVPQDIRVRREAVMFVPEAELWTLIGARTAKKRIGIDPSHNTEHARSSIEATGAKAIEISSPIAAMKAKKNPVEMQAMKVAFAKADLVVEKAQKWLCSQVVKGARVTEADFARQVGSLFRAAGAAGLSFKIISAAGRNGAIIHYSEPSEKRVIKRGELMLLDTGAYFDEGYATDLTRTFLVDSAKARGTQKQRRYYTLVLKCAIAGMSARLPERARGSQLDALVRAPLWAEALDYAHGTGHGVGINVHEAPPRVAPNTDVLIEEGQVFSIEPGYYLAEFGGIRIENLCTVHKLKRQPGFIEVEPLTFCPLDKRLIEPKLLSSEEKAWLSRYSKVHNSPARRKLRGEKPNKKRR